ncbi:hypothetical protein VTO73DRAFT_10372 [Trametes versicolor]
MAPESSSNSHQHGREPPGGSSRSHDDWGSSSSRQYRPDSGPYDSPRGGGSSGYQAGNNPYFPPPPNSFSGPSYSGPPPFSNQGQGPYPPSYDYGHDYDPRPTPSEDPIAAIVRMYSENGALMRQIGDLRVELANGKNAHGQLQKELDGARSQLHALREENTKLRAEVEKLRTDARDDEGSRPHKRRDDRDDRYRLQRDDRDRGEVRTRRTDADEERRDYGRTRSPTHSRPRDRSPARLGQGRQPSPPRAPLSERIRGRSPARPRLQERLQDPPKSLRERIDRRATPPNAHHGSAPTAAPVDDVEMTDAAAKEPLPKRRPSPRNTTIAKTAAPNTPHAASVGARAPPPPIPESRAPPMQIPSTQGMSDEAIDALRHQPDQALDVSGQPQSAWYLRWKSALTMAEEYEDLEMDDESGSDTSDMGRPEFGSPFPDPIVAYRSLMTPAAEEKEGYRVARTSSKPTHKIAVSAAIEEFRTATAQLGKWAGTTITSVVQAHNLRWWAAVEFDNRAIAYYRAVNQLYTHPAIRRSAGVRYLLQVYGTDRATIGRGHRDDLPSRPQLGNAAFPKPSATQLEVVAYYRNVPTSHWSIGMRRADGKVPEHSATIFGVPHKKDAFAAFVIKHITTVPPSLRSSETRTHSGVLKTTIVTLFSVTGLYEAIVTKGGYKSVKPAPPAPYPYSVAGLDIVRVAAWLCCHGIGTKVELVSYLRRWARTARNRALHRVDHDETDWPDAPRSVDEFMGSEAALLVVDYRDLPWGTRVIDIVDRAVPRDPTPVPTPIVPPASSSNPTDALPVLGAATDPPARAGHSRRSSAPASSPGIHRSPVPAPSIPYRRRGESEELIDWEDEYDDPPARDGPPPLFGAEDDPPSA